MYHVHLAWVGFELTTLVPDKVNKGITPDRIKSVITLGISVLVADLAYKFQMICLREAKGIEWIPNVGHTDMGIIT